MNETVTVDVSFPFHLASLAPVPRDHGYALYGAIARAVPGLHEASWLGIHPLSGRPIDAKNLDLGIHPRLSLRLPSDHIREVLPLAGTTLCISGRRAVVGAPTIHALRPADSLDARMVAIKLTDVPLRSNTQESHAAEGLVALAAGYTKELARQLAAIQISKPFELQGKRVLTVARRRVVGFAVRVTGLSEDESLRLLANGVGGKRRMGCGIFRPTRAK